MNMMFLGLAFWRFGYPLMDEYVAKIVKSEKINVIRF